uniref:COesterase domain-containing protein n=1 Tax=Toxocara canis TaxID=6265 RepID=A0A183U1G1_TOXCA
LVELAVVAYNDKIEDQKVRAERTPYMGNMLMKVGPPNDAEQGAIKWKEVKSDPAAYIRTISQDMQPMSISSITENGLIGCGHLIAQRRKSYRKSELGGTIDRVSSIAFPSVSV